MILFSMIALWAVSGCAPTPIEVELNFPSQENFLFSSFARLLVFPVAADQLDRCPLLLEEAEAGTFNNPIFDSGSLELCQWRNGGVRLDDVAAGPHAYLVLAEDQSNQVILSGCRIAEVYQDAPTIRVHLFPTDRYVTTTVGMTPPFNSIQEKCGP